ncbi:MAG: 3-deoxy-D-manno-octulosonic acid transferase, partial [Pseudomonadota bacterium]
HPRRHRAIEKLATSRGLSVALRSRHDAADAEVYIADTLGEMALWYSLAGVTFVGGSLVDRGGHTPFEPAQFESAILHGPNTRNFADAYAALNASNGAIRVDDTAGLAAALDQVSDADRQRQVAGAAKRWLASLPDSQKARDAIVAWVAQHLP